MKIYVRRKILFDEILSFMKNPQLLQNTNLSIEDVKKAYLEYEEEGETDLEIIEQIPYRTFLRLMQPKPVELIEIIKNEQLYISEIARKLNRSISNVYYDLKILNKHKIISFNKSGKYTIPILLLKEIRINI
ncbi:MAG: hypothetical protein J7K23_04770 [Thermoproteales archaeon]|nr:hypothetical protein [Thermoproteales archaeon]